MPFFDFLDKASLGVEAAKAKLRQQLVATNPNLQFASQYKGKSDGSSARATKYTKAEVEKRIADLKRQQEELKHKKPRNPNSPPSSQEVLSDQNSKQNLKDIEKELAFLERYKGYAKALETGDNTKVLKYLRNLEEDKNGTRNYFFTAEYARMGLEIDKILGGGGANWSLYGAIASETVGKGIRDEASLEFPLGFGKPSDSDSAIPMLIQGNEQIFRSVAPALYAFVDFNKQNSQLDTKAFTQFLDKRGVEKDKDLRDGLMNYYKARFETDPLKKQELIVLANIQIAAHEQRLVQDELKEIFNEAPFYGDWFNKISGNEVKDRANEEVMLAWDGFHVRATEQSPPTDNYNLRYKNLIDPNNIQNPELKALMRIYAEMGKSEGQAANDYDNYGERMYWIASNMLRHGTQEGIWTTAKQL